MRDTAPSMPTEIATVFEAMPADVAVKLRQMRTLIYAVAEAENVAPLSETLKWGEPSYATVRTKAGTPIRLGWSRKTPKRCAMFVNCQTTLLDQYRERYGDELEFQGNRAVVIPTDGPLNEAPVVGCIALALTYHRNKRLRAGG
ncbi:MAG: DUF1801 domain-containing protein [Pseudomonadota bacterium]